MDSHHGYMHHGHIHPGYMHHGYMHHGYMDICILETFIRDIYIMETHYGYKHQYSMNTFQPLPYLAKLQFSGTTSLIHQYCENIKSNLLMKMSNIESVII